MAIREAYEDKFSRICVQTPLNLLPQEQQAFIRNKALKYRFTFQELKKITEIALDFLRWNEAPIMTLWPAGLNQELSAREAKKQVIRGLENRWNTLKCGVNSYERFNHLTKPKFQRIEFGLREKEKLGLGHCPVASRRTRCCNLLTLDAVENCGFDCSYCSIQSFYHNNRIYFDARFSEKLGALELDPDEIYHIGTGQSSDSLMWGNKNDILDTLVEFARNNANVILEMKSKSKNISYLLKHDIPKNIICTWSLNTQKIITHEEHLTASLDNRIHAARKIADRGIIVGFHFHPMVHYDSWKEDYAEIFTRITAQFQPWEVAMVSIGTLTFIPSVIKQIRARNFKSKILQMPLVNSDGKFSYPDGVKLELFSHAYACLSDWHDSVFFYLCMENHRLWKPVFGFEFDSNEAFERAMKTSYMNKISAAKNGTKPLKRV